MGRNGASARVMEARGRSCLGGSSVGLYLLDSEKDFHGHFPTPEAVPLGGTLEAATTRQWTIPVARTSHRHFPVTSL